MILPIPVVAALATASFTFAPGAPAPGQDVQFESGDTAAVTTAWDFDNDGAFDDGEGRRAKHAFAAGTQVVRMRSRYATAPESVAQQTIQVGSATPAPTPTATPAETPPPTPT